MPFSRKEQDKIVEIIRKEEFSTFKQVDHDALPNPHHSNSLDHSNANDHVESHAVNSHSDTIATGAQLNTLVGGGETTLHSHAGGGGQAFPIGSVFLAVVNTNPNTLLGYGTWSQIAQGKFLVGQNPADTDFDVAEETGGAKTHTLTIAEIPSHNHILGELRSATTGSAASYIARTADTSSTRGTDKTTELSGGGLAHNNLPPYFTIFIWKRTA